MFRSSLKNVNKHIESKKDDEVRFADIYVLHKDPRNSKGERKEELSPDETSSISMMLKKMSKKNDGNFQEKNINIDESFYTIKTRPDIERLKAYINTLAGVANTYHCHKYCENINNKFIPKKNSRNVVTRILMPEYSLNTTKPLSLDEYGDLCKEVVERIATKCVEGVHLVLSSIPVVTPKGELLNMTMYVECGETPRLHSICKSYAAEKEYFYEGTTPFSTRDFQALEEENRVAGELNRKNLAFDFVADNDGMVYPTNGVFPVNLYNASYVQTLEICFEHQLERATHLYEKYLYKKKLDCNEVLDDEEELVDHLLLSNWIPPLDYAIPNLQNFVHVDARLTYKKLVNNINNYDMRKMNQKKTAFGAPPTVFLPLTERVLSGNEFFKMPTQLDLVISNDRTIAENTIRLLK